MLSFWHQCTVFHKFLTHKSVVAWRLFWAYIATCCLTFPLFHCAYYWELSEPEYRPEQDVWCSHPMFFSVLLHFLKIILIWCAYIPSSVPTKAWLLGNLDKHFLHSGEQTSWAWNWPLCVCGLPLELFWTSASHTSSHNTAGRLQLRRAHMITAPPEDSTWGHFSPEALTGILKGRKFPWIWAK